MKLKIFSTALLLLVFFLWGRAEVEILDLKYALKVKESIIRTYQSDVKKAPIVNIYKHF